MWAIAAPASALSIAASAICLGVIGTLLERCVVAPAPVTAAVMKVSRAGCKGMMISLNFVELDRSQIAEIIILRNEFGEERST